jgi:hypothetical protein
MPSQASKSSTSRIREQQESEVNHSLSRLVQNSPPHETVVRDLECRLQAYLEAIRLLTEAEWSKNG